MPQTLVNFRIDEEDKGVTKCDTLGGKQDLTIFANKVVREKRIPFEISVDPFYCESNIKELKESIKQVKEGKVVSFSMNSLEAMEK